MSDATHFIHDARMAVYAVPADSDAPEEGAEAIYDGLCLQNLRMRERVETRVRHAHGRARGRAQVVDGEYEISFERVWKTRNDVGDTIEIPGVELPRTGRYCAVVVFYDREHGHRVKWIFYGVTPGDREVGPGNQGVMLQSRQLRAEQLSETAGLPARPDLSAILTGLVLWLSAGLSTIAYTYDNAAAAFASTGLVATATMGVNEGGSGLPAGTDAYLQIGGTPVLAQVGGETRVGELIALGASLDSSLDPDTTDRIEMWFGGRRFASLTAANGGTLMVRNAIEGAVDAGEAGFILKDSGDTWLAALLDGGLRTGTIAEALVVS